MHVIPAFGSPSLMHSAKGIGHGVKRFYPSLHALCSLLCLMALEAFILRRVALFHRSDFAESVTIHTGLGVMDRLMNSICGDERRRDAFA